ncbi:MAG TPA: nuclear transport factor 2 family protein [Chthonomonadaceae bacterium]|nr:nuclear transport factor 2 family protein [Chthonomonadaceae bacterium]
MRLIILLLLWIACIGPALPATASADAASAARNAIQAAYNRREAAFQRKDLRAYLSTFAPDYRVLSRSGIVYDTAFVRQQFLRAVASGSDILSRQASMNILKLSLKGKAALVTVKSNIVMKGRYRLSQAPYQSTDDSLLEAIWVKTARGWQESHVRVLSRRTVLTE